MTPPTPHSPNGGKSDSPVLRRVYWETTAGCNLRCIHCRRTDVLNQVSPDELSLGEARTMIDDLASAGKPVLILSGGEPLFRRDIFEIASYAHGKGLPVALSTNGTLVTESLAKKIRSSGVYYASISLDGARAETHDIFRGPGNYERALAGFLHLKAQDIKVQINFTVTRQNVAEVPAMLDLARSLEAQALYFFLLVPVGCGVQIAESQMLTSLEVDGWLEWIARVQEGSKMEVRAICAPQFYRVQAESLERRSKSEEARALKEKRLGCLAGSHICFVSHLGEVYPCGYLPVSAGNVKRSPLTRIWRESTLFHSLRDPSLLQGKCGGCSYATVCGGCRARAYYQHGSELAEEPYCLYEPDSLASARPQ